MPFIEPPISPLQAIERERIKSNLTDTELVFDKLRFTKEEASAFLDGNMYIDYRLANQLAHIFPDSSFRYWVNVQRRYTQWKRQEFLMRNDVINYFKKEIYQSPSEAILKEMYDKRLTHRELARAMNIHLCELNSLLTQEIDITETVAKRLCQVFPHTTPVYWLAIQKEFYQYKQQRTNNGQLQTD